MIASWTDQDLANYRQQVETEIVVLVAEILPKRGGETIGAFGHSRMLLPADQLVKTPSLGTRVKITYPLVFHSVFCVAERLTYNEYEPLSAP